MGLSGILLLTALVLYTCGLSPPNDLKNEDEHFTDVVYSEDGKTVTIYLNGYAPVPANRSLTQSLAKHGHDFFEVAFMCSKDGVPANYIIARGSWELGQPAGVNGVFRGVDYGTPISSTLSADEGTAILFVGKKTRTINSGVENIDRTLLAVGSLSAVDNVPGATMITSTTTSVSFAVNALKAGTNKVAGASSFQTNARNTATGWGGVGTYTDVSDFSIKYYLFPVFVVKSDDEIFTEYTLGVQSTTNGLSFDTYRRGIVIGPGANRYPAPIKPHFTMSDAIDGSALEFTSDDFLFWNPISPALITLNNNYTANDQFENPIRYILDTAGAPNRSIFSFAFEIPVYALSSAPSADQTPACLWWIRPGYDKYLSELDDGKGGSGGAVLIGIGDVSQFGGYKLVIKKYPRIQYNADPGQGFYFSTAHNSTTIMTMELQTNDGTFIRDVLVSQVDFSIDFNNDGYYAPGIYPTGEYFINGTELAHDKNYYIDVRVHYHDDILNEDFYAYYKINIITFAVDFSDIPEANRIVVVSENSFTQLINSMSGTTPAFSGTYLVVLAASFNIPNATMNLSGNDITIVFTSNVPGVTIGRFGGSTIQINGNGNVLLFFGTWPFDEPVMAGGDILNDMPYRINAGGMYQEWAPDPPPPALPTLPPASTQGGYFATKGGGGGTLTVYVGPDVNVASSTQLSN